MAERISQYVQAYTLYSSVRPFGVSGLIASHDRNAGFGLYMVEPSGVHYGYSGSAIGKGRTVAKTELEKLNFSELTAREAVKVAAKM
jgi:20S proteasome subunit alpha 7